LMLCTGPFILFEFVNILYQELENNLNLFLYVWLF
jgi:hypothetical protein